MGFLDRLLGREEPQRAWNQQNTPSRADQRSDDEIAVERYRYLLRTAPPETIEKVHEEAFAKLTAEQRGLLFTQLSQNAPAGDHPRGDDPRSLAQAATRSEIRQPGTLERSLGGGGGRVGFGGMFASSLLGSVAGFVIGSAIVSAFLPDPVDQQASDGDGGSGDDGSGDDSSAAGDDSSGDAAPDGGGWDSGSDFGGDFGGGGDFGDF